MAKIKYRLGQERDIVRERQSFEDSIFSEQYQRALMLIDDFVANADIDSEDFNDSPLKMITFCGDRGEGKTSCLVSVLEILKACDKCSMHKVAKRNDVIDEAYEFIRKCQAINIKWTKFAFLPLVDPSFFDETHNVLQIIIGQMYNEFCTSEKKADYSFQSSLNEAFQKVKNDLTVTSQPNGSRFEKSNTIQSLNCLASAIQLKADMANLVKLYLKYFDKDVLVVSIDDVDLAFEHSYFMCEQLRKYLCIPGCIVMMCAKVPQLQELIGNQFLEKSGRRHYFIDDRLSANENESPIMGETDEVAKKYIDKLLPVSSRIDMPKAYSMCDVEIEIVHNHHTIEGPRPLKDCILELIFKRTRYLFYNPVGGISPIMPNNLRELFNLIGLLASMQMPDNSKDILKTNKMLFKTYFYTVWKDRFNYETQIQLNNLLDYDYGTSFNREVVKILINHFDHRLNKDYNNPHDDEDPDGMVGIKRKKRSGVSSSRESNESAKDSKSPSKVIYDSIVSADNFGYNVTTGDVFYLFSMLEKETLSESGFALLFFLKSLYSIRMYETYEFITENENQIYPDLNPENKGLTVVDHRFDHTNKLQQLIGGSYFTYAPGDLLPLNADLRIVNAKPVFEHLRSLKDKFAEIKRISVKNENDRTVEENKFVAKFNVELNVIEFFILVTKCFVRMKNETDQNRTVPDTLTLLRKNVEPFHFKRFYNSQTYYIIDVLALFSNIVNPKFSYQRFSVINDEYYNDTLNYPGSLLYKMMECCAPHRQHISYPEDNHREKYHQLLSIAAIRNSDILTAIKDNLILKRYLYKGSWDQAMIQFYEDIQKNEMSTHGGGRGEDPYKINFHFLEAIQNLLNDIVKDDEANHDIKETARTLFYDLFAPMSDVMDEQEVIEKMKSDIRSNIIRKKHAKTIVEYFMKETPFNKIGKTNLTEFVERTLVEFNKKSIGKWFDANYDRLTQAIRQPEVLEKEKDRDFQVSSTNPQNNHIIPIPPVNANADEASIPESDNNIAEVEVTKMEDERMEPNNDMNNAQEQDNPQERNDHEDNNANQ